MCGTGRSAGVWTGDKDSGTAITHPPPTTANRLPADDGFALAASESFSSAGERSVWRNRVDKE